MRENIAESLRLREETDTELANGLVSKEASMNMLNRTSPSKPMNLHQNTVTKASTSNLTKMHENINYN